MACPRTHKTRDGAVLLISEMDDDHLRNVIRMIDRARGPLALAAVARLAAAGESLGGEGARDAFDRDMEEMAEWGDEEILYRTSPRYRAYIDEANRRGGGPLVGHPLFRGGDA